MKLLGTVGDGARSLLERLPPALDGRVAAVERHDAAPGVPSDATAAFELGEDGWAGAGTDRSLAGLLDDLTPRYDYAVVAGFPDLRAPTVVVGEADPAGEVVVRAEDPDEVDPEEVAAALASTDPRVTLESLVREAKASPRAEFAGAIATFTGRVRERDDESDARTTHLAFEKYEGVAEERMDALAGELSARDGVQEVLMHHRTGVVEAGEDIVFVVVLAGHREEAFATVEDGIDRLKQEVPIFKKETTVEEAFWLHQRE